jgi:hypothetical protein
MQLIYGWKLQHKATKIQQQLPSHQRYCLSAIASITYGRQFGSLPHWSYAIRYGNSWIGFGRQ